MLRNMSVSLLRHETIRTRSPSEGIARVVDPLITLAKKTARRTAGLPSPACAIAEVVEKLS